MTFPFDAINAAMDRLSRHPFYSGRFPSTISGPSEYAEIIPLMSRTDLVSEMQKPGYGAFGGLSPVRMNLSPMGGGLVPVMQTRRDLDRMIAACRTHLDACGVEEGDVCAVFFGYHLFVAGLFYQSQMEAHGVTCIPLGPGEADRAVDICNAHNVNILAGNPSFSLRLLEAGVTPPKVFFAGGEAFSGNRTLFNSIAHAMPETMLVDSFSLSEFLPVGRTFPGGQGVHIFDELVYAEVIDPETLEPVKDGDRGELVLTHLQKEAQPLIRYRTGDLTVKIVTPSVFGRTACLPNVVFGRTDEMVKVKGVKLYPSEFRTILLGVEGLDGAYRLLVSGNTRGGDRLSLLLQGEGGDETAEIVSKRFKSQTLVSVDEIIIKSELGAGPLLLDERG